jgi:hypothetical protein
LSQQNSTSIASESRPSTPVHEYLACLQALRLQLSLAIEAIAKNDVGAFSQGVTQQLALCTRLTELAAKHRLPLSGLWGTTDTSAVEDIDRQIREAQMHLLQVNRDYAALLKHTGRTVQMLCRATESLAGYTASGRPLEPAARRTWSVVS